MDPTKGPFFKGYAFLFSNGAHGSIASSLAISFASRVLKEVTRRPRQLMGEPRPCGSTLSDLENRECGMAEKLFPAGELRVAACAEATGGAFAATAPRDAVVASEGIVLDNVEDA